MSDERGARLDELNAATVLSHARNIWDRGLAADDPGSALRVGRSGEPDSPQYPSLLAELRANAEQVYGDPPASPRRAPKTS